jgi:type I restriction enzyme S subunit
MTTLADGPLEIIDGDRGKNYPKQGEFASSGQCLFLNAGNVTTGGFNFSDCAFISAEKDAALHKGKLRRYDIVLTTRGTVGNVAYFDNSIPYDHIRINSGMVIFRARAQELRPRFLYLFLRSSLFREQVESLRTGSAQPQLPIKDINRVEFPIPPLDDQDAIAHILGALDDKILLNQRMNETLEAMARALFKSWFVDFDPIRAKAESRDPGLPKPLASLFPDSFEESEMGDIPKGWRIRPFAETVEIFGGGTPKTAKPEYWNGDIPWFSVVDAPRDADVWVVDSEKKITQAGVESSSTKVLPEGTTIITARGTVGRIALVGVPMAMNQSCYGLRGKIRAKGSFTYFMTRKIVSALKQSAHGSVFDTITRDSLAGVSVVEPPDALIELFEQRVDSTLERIRACLLESRTLASLRDALLPKLISGDLQLPDVRRIVGGDM